MLADPELKPSVFEQNKIKSSQEKKMWETSSEERNGGKKIYRKSDHGQIQFSKIKYDSKSKHLGKK